MQFTLDYISENLLEKSICIVQAVMLALESQDYIIPEQL